MTDDAADRIARGALDLEATRTALKAKYYDSVKSALSAKQAARFLQIENQLLLLIDLQIAASLPIVESDDDEHLSRVVTTLAAVVALATATVSADRSGCVPARPSTASFLSADVTVVRFLLANGTIAELPVEEISAIEFAPRPSRSRPPAPDPAQAPTPITVPQGTVAVASG